MGNNTRLQLTAIVASGMHQVHSTEEHAHLSELVRLSELLTTLLSPPLSAA